MNWELIVAGGAALLVFLYLVYAMLHPEKF
ncbi:MAG: potassium-transporting ATPase subunit F [Anaerolineae bacterium]|nr:potassium-transporting ATPase subunit F [Anaerolineae bacterium]